MNPKIRFLSAKAAQSESAEDFFIKFTVQDYIEQKLCEERAKINKNVIKIN